MNHKNLDPNIQDKLDELTGKVIRFFSVVLAASIIAFCYALARLEGGFLRTLVFILSSLLGIFSVFVILVMVAGSIDEDERNFFLYDQKSKTEISAGTSSVDDIPSLRLG